MDRVQLTKKVDPAHTALIVVDMQRDYCCMDGILSKMGFDITPVQELAPRLAVFVDQARKALRHIIHAKMVTLLELRSPAITEQYRRVGLERTPDPSLSDFFEVIPRPGDVIIPKYRYSGFVSTYLERYLRANNLQTLVVTGVATNVCVESTVRDGFMHDYSIVVPHDMTEGTSREAKEWSLETLGRFFAEVVDSHDLLHCWDDCRRQKTG